MTRTERRKCIDWIAEEIMRRYGFNRRRAELRRRIFVALWDAAALGLAGATPRPATPAPRGERRRGK